MRYSALSSLSRLQNPNKDASFATHPGTNPNGNPKPKNSTKMETTKKQTFTESIISLRKGETLEVGVLTTSHIKDRAIKFRIQWFDAFNNSHLAVQYFWNNEWSRIKVFPDLHEGARQVCRFIDRTADRLLNEENLSVVMYTREAPKGL